MRLASAERGFGLRGDRGTCGESRASGLWGSRRGGRGSNGRNRDAVRRGLLLLLLLALAAPLAASAGDHGGKPVRSYVAGQPSGYNNYQACWRSSRATPGCRCAQASSRPTVPPIRSSGSPRRGRHDPGERASTRARYAAGARAVAEQPGRARRAGGQAGANGASGFDPIWQSGVGVDQLWPGRVRPHEAPASEGHGQRVSAGAGDRLRRLHRVGRADLGNRILANVNLSDLPNNSPGDGFGTARSSPASQRARTPSTPARPRRPASSRSTSWTTTGWPARAT